MKPVRKNRLKRRRRAAREAKTAVVESTDEENDQPPIRTHRKRRKKEPDYAEDVIDGFLIRSSKNLELLHEPKNAENLQQQAGNVSAKIENSQEKKEESPESSSVQAIDESYASSASTRCGGYLGEYEKSEEEDGKVENKITKNSDDDDFFRTARTDERLKESFKQVESEPTDDDDDDDDVILCPTPEPRPVCEKKIVVTKHVVQPKSIPNSTTATTTQVSTVQVPPPEPQIRNIVASKELKKPRQHVKVPPTMTVQPEQRKSNLVMPMIPVVKPTSSLVGSASQSSYGGLNSRRPPATQQMPPAPQLYPNLPAPPMPAHPSLLDQGYLQAELNSRFLQESQAAERQRNEFHHAHQHSLAHHTFNRVVSLPPPSYGPSYYAPTTYGAFHPKMHHNFTAHVVNQSSFHPQSHPVLTMSQISKDPTLSAPCKKHSKPGRWCALHVKIAIMIQNHQKKQDKGEVIRSQKNKVSSFYTPQQLSSSDASRPSTINSALAWRSRRPPVYPPPQQAETAQSSNYHHHTNMLPMTSNLKQNSASALYHHPHHLPHNTPGTGPSSINHSGQPMTELSRAPAHVLHSRYDYYTPPAIANGANPVAAASMLPPTNTIPPPFPTSLLPTAATNPFYQHAPQYYLCGAGAMNGGAASAAAAAHHHPYVRR